jgi:hypothetical protein
VGPMRKTAGGSRVFILSGCVHRRDAEERSFEKPQRRQERKEKLQLEHIVIPRNAPPGSEILILNGFPPRRFGHPDLT